MNKNKKDIVNINLVDKDGDNETKVYRVIVDEGFEDSIGKLKDLANNYECFEDIEDFINENFELINYCNEDDIYIEY